MKKLFVIIGIVFCIGMNSGMAYAHNVYYNTNSHIYHKHSCKWAKKCTKNCISIDHTDARARGGRPCQVCGG